MKKIFVALVILASSVSSAGACGLVFDTDALERGSPALSDGAVDTESSVDAGDEASACPGSLDRGPKMISTGDGQCIDATEVTVADYEIFLNQAPSPPTFPKPCDWVTTLRPETFDAQLTTPKHPVVDVNYCHAFHYCAWAGKRLCGHINGTEIAPGDAGMDPVNNQWLRACTHKGEQSYSYGTKLVEAICKTNSLVDVGTRNVCSGAYPGLFDMLGNVGEWIDACSSDGVTRQRDGCMVLGLEHVRDEASCWDVAEYSRYWTERDLGFRCCGKL